MTTPALRYVQRLYNLSIHEDNSKEAIIFNAEKFPELNIRPGDLIQIAPIRQTDTKNDEDHTNGTTDQTQTTSLPIGGIFPKVTFDENGTQTSSHPEPDTSRVYVFVYQPPSADLNQKYGSAVLSVSQSVANAFGYRKWTQVLVSIANEGLQTASHVEISFKDEYMSRGDMWRMVFSELSQKTVFKDQKLVFLDSIRAQIRNIYVNGEKQRYGFFGPNTRPVFRSESARFVVFIQMSKEMWDFDVEGGSEIMFNKVINGFLPELFKNWMSIQARHLVTIVLFSRVEYEDGEQTNFSSFNDKRGTKPGSRDFYRVVVNDMSSNDWIRILTQLKTEFTSFLKDILTFPCDKATEDVSDSQNISPQQILGKVTTASKGNILEAISLASSQFSRDWIDRDLSRTGISVIVITAGSGVYEVDYRLLKFITEILIKGGIGIDLVCLAPMPLHSVPLFKYKSPRLINQETLSIPQMSSTENTPRQSDISAFFSSRMLHQNERSLDPTPGEWSFAIPHWIDVSFWKGAADEPAAIILSQESRPSYKKGITSWEKPFSIRCVLYELEMMGVMEQELINIGIENLYENPMHPWHKMRHRINGRPASEIDRKSLNRIDDDWMAQYDNNMFQPHRKRKAAEETARKKAQSQSLDSISKSNVATLTEPLPDRGLRHGGGYLDWKIKEKERSSTTISTKPRRKSSILSITSMTDRESITSRTSAVARHISLGTVAPPQGDFQQALADKVTATAVPSIELPKLPSASKYLEQFKSALYRSSTKPTSKPIEESLPTNPPVTSSKEPVINENPSKPIDIGPSKRVKHARSSSSDEHEGSLETVKAKSSSPRKNSLEMRPEDSAIFYAASTSRRAYPKSNLSPTGSTAFPETLSPIKALAPWLVLVNPSNPRKNNWNSNNQFRRWQHIFPKQLKASSMKWKSLSSPASVPLTNEFFPSEEQFAKEYQESTYKITINPDDELPEAPKNRDSLIRELISLRLASGFQLIVGSDVAEFTGQPMDSLNIFDKQYMSRDGDIAYMSIGNVIHRIMCLTGGEVEIRRYTRRPAAEIKMRNGSDSLNYQPYIRGASHHTYGRRDVLFKPPRTEANWNFVDHWISGYGDGLSEPLEFWRARYVFIPVDLPTPKRRNLATLTEDSEEEIRLEGIRKLTHIWQRHRVLPSDDNKHQPNALRKDLIPPLIEYQTRDPSAVIAAGVDGLLLDGVPSRLGDLDFSTDNIDLYKLANELQGEHGIKMLDRRWHLRLHTNCFIGADLVTWLIQRFRDIREREHAEQFGVELMKRDLFQHVQRKHNFRDGQFFYQITPEYRIQKDARGWFGSTKAKEKPSVPSTPMTEVGKLPYTLDPKIRPPTSDSTETLDETIDRGDTPTKKRKIRLSGYMRYNVDLKKQSYRPEIITLHYDRLHSPDNCYHFRIEWLNVTSKLIEDCISQWAVHGRKYGLRLVQMPIPEATKLVEDHPFRATHRIRLAVPPPEPLDEPLSTTTSGSSNTASSQKAPHVDPFIGQKAVLKHLGFVLDMESVKSFPDDVEIEYSWGRNDYRYSQYIHRSGIAIAQISDDGDFLIIANRLYNEKYILTQSDNAMTPNPNTGSNTHSSNVNSTPSRDRDRLANSPTTLRPVSNSPASSPSLRAFGDGGPQQSKQLSVEEIRAEVEAFCSDEKALRAFYMEMNKTKPSPALSPFTTPARGPINSPLGFTPLGDVPRLRLPPRTLGLGGEMMTREGNESRESNGSSGSGMNAT